MHFTQIALFLVAVPALVVASPAASEGVGKTVHSRTNFWSDKGVRYPCAYQRIGH